MLEMGRMVSESVLLIEREEVAGPDYYPTDPDLQKWAHEADRKDNRPIRIGTDPNFTAP